MSIYSTFEVFQLDRSNVVSEEQPVNIEVISLTLEVFQLDKFIDFKFIKL